MKPQEHKIINPPLTKVINNVIILIPFFLIFLCGLIIGSSFFSYTSPFSNLFLNLRFTTTATATATTSTSPIIILQSPPPPPLPSPPPTPKTVPMHEMEDDELLWRASMAPKIRGGESRFGGTPKVAFLFLVRGPLPMGPLWDRFFRGHELLYTIYVHANSSYDQNYPTDSVFFNRRIPSKKVDWGNFNMIQAERRLLANALLDQSNQRFVLLSESCIPLFDFKTIYNYLISSKKSHIEVYDEKGATGRGRYSNRMSPVIELSQWRKGSQWFEMDRKLALEVISDQVYFPLFGKHCKNACYGDEHYLPTYTNIKFSEQTTNRTITWVDWSKIGPHPGRYERPRVTIELLKRLRDGYSCEYNGKKTNICYLFARKFMPSSLNRLLMFAPRLMRFG